MFFAGRVALEIYCDDCVWETSAKRNWYNRDLTKAEWKKERSEGYTIIETFY